MIDIAWPFWDVREAAALTQRACMSLGGAGAGMSSSTVVEPKRLQAPPVAGLEAARTIHESASRASP
ncbi:hypothetical protein ACFPYM_17480, partial [Methylobacterium hispanicum]